MENYVRCDVRTSVLEVTRLMRRKHTGTAVVVDESGAPIGILTDRDITMRCVALEKDIARTPAGETMSPDFRTLPADYRLEALIDSLRGGYDPGRVLIIDEGHRPIGRLRYDDIFAALAEAFDSMIARESTAGVIDVIDEAA